MKIYSEPQCLISVEQTNQMGYLSLLLEHTSRHRIVESTRMDHFGDHNIHQTITPVPKLNTVLKVHFSKKSNHLQEQIFFNNITYKKQTT